MVKLVAWSDDVREDFRRNVATPTMVQGQRGTNSVPYNLTGVAALFS